MIQSYSTPKKEHQPIFSPQNNVPKNKQSVQFKDNRPELATQLKIQKIANASTQSETIQMKSKVETHGQKFQWGPHAQTTVGRYMKAWLDPGQILQGESAGINKDQDNMMSAIRDYYDISGGDLVKGHLLNDNLGGKAMNNNLFPITRAANKHHLMVAENYAKKELWGNKKPIWYTVEVAGTPHLKTNTHDFKVELGHWAGGTNYSNASGKKIGGSITSNFGFPRDYDLANGEDMESHSAESLAYAVKHGLAYRPHTRVGDLSKDESNARDNTDNVTSTYHDSSGAYKKIG